MTEVAEPLAVSAEFGEGNAVRHRAGAGESLRPVP